VALEEPLHDIPDLPEASEAGFRQIHEFYEVWKTAGLRIMENSFDNAHFSFVHRESFGIQENPDAGKVSIEQKPWGFLMTTAMPVKNPEIQKAILGMSEAHTTRYMRSSWFMPFSRSLKITYPNGRIHIIVTATMALMVFFTVIVVGIAKNGAKFLKLFVPSGVPWYILWFVVLIDIISFFSRPLSHAVRLWANVLAGHLVLKVFAGFVPMMAAAGGIWVLGSVLPLTMTVALYALEFLVAFLQAYVFALLTCIYLNDALHPGH